MICVSIVSHGHGLMLLDLIDALLPISEIEKIIITINIPENISLPPNSKIMVIENSIPKGFGANHNFAFTKCSADFFCPLNPDIKIINNPFPELLSVLSLENRGLVAPQIRSTSGVHQDSWRRFPTVLNLLMRIFNIQNSSYLLPNDMLIFNVEWTAGMFMLFKAQAFKDVKGFDEDFFLYCEDIDICCRLKREHWDVVACPFTFALHDAQRDSRRKFRYMVWHIQSYTRLFIKKWILRLY